mgnify:CR=1 FL=1
MLATGRIFKIFNREHPTEIFISYCFNNNIENQLHKVEVNYRNWLKKDEAGRKKFIKRYIHYSRNTKIVLSSLLKKYQIVVKVKLNSAQVNINEI